MVKDFIQQNNNNNIKLLKSCGKCHNRLIIIDYQITNQTIYHCGAFIKDARNKITMITKHSLNKELNPTIKELLNNPTLLLP